MITKRSQLIDKNKNVIGVRVETNKDTFDIPIADVRVNRKRADNIIKASNISKGSKFFNPSYSGMGYSYNLSMKK